MRDLSSWLPELEPPPGGLARLRRRIVRPSIAHWRALAAAACGVCLIAGCIVPVAIEHHRARVNLEATLRQAVQRPAPGTLRMIGGAAIALESGQPGVRLYLVQSARGAAITPAR